MAENTVFTIGTQPGIRRDGTTVDGNFYSDGTWVRFQRGRPKKMQGFRRILNGLNGIPSKILVWSRQDLNAVFAFSPAKAEMMLVDNNGIGNSITDRTPAAFSAPANCMWTADTQYDAAVGSAATIVVAHASSSANNIDDDTATKPYWATADGATAFVSLTDCPAVSGGVFASAPYTIVHGSDGFVGWSDANQPQVWSTSAVPGDAGSARVTGSKVVKGLPLRSGAGPSAILWSLDSVIRMEYIGGSAIFRFSTLSAQSSILAQNSVIEYDGAYFWIGVDRFMMFSSAVQELPNNMNQNYFFDNLNYAYRQKIWATKVPRFGEIWWFYPRGDATECSHAIIFNVREKVWYDVELARSAGFYSQTLHYPIMSGNTVDPDATSTYSLFAHEQGKDAVVGDNQTAILSSFTTSNFGFPTGGMQDSLQGLNNWTRLTRVEPDFIQTGNMQLEVLGYEFAATAPDAVLSTYTFGPDDGKVDMREQHRYIQLRFTSNEAGGFYEGGKIVVHTELGDLRS